ncbi:MAG: DUF507 family protein [Candidatus Rokubacteria bacterium]|nr:DUF507 family protein [Candidatus Rokubacteria bacterium]MBI2544578.1 DUF507 family protein [Candidatus Rokubacteria bacterium]MBI2553454.1 DUF507 family protein [Candidatus Rokubacteria bacterium]
MPRREAMAERVADAVVKRLRVKKLVEARDETAARAAVRKVLLENLQAEERLDAEARQILMEHTKEIRDTAVDYARLLALVRGKLARERGFIL